MMQNGNAKEGRITIPDHIVVVMPVTPDIIGQKALAMVLSNR
jgi:hypothetical protein